MVWKGHWGRGHPQRGLERALGPWAPSSWSGKGTGAGGTLSVVWKGHWGRGHPPSLTSYPPALDAIMDRALAKNPDDRYATAEEFAGGLAMSLNCSISTSPSGNTALIWSWSPIA